MTPELKAVLLGFVESWSAGGGQPISGVVAAEALREALDALDAAERERDGYRNGQAQIQRGFDFLWHANNKTAKENAALRAEVERLRKMLRKARRR
jgi:hypothetical protein